jgi:hypothetical protein
MTLANLAAYVAALNQPPEPIPITIGAGATVAGRTYDMWRASFPLGAIPTTPVAPNNDTLGAFGQRPYASLSVLAARMNTQVGGSLMLIDRLSHQAGLNATLTSEQTTNLPTAALTRYTTGVGVKIGLTIYTAVGGTTSSVTVSYTNQAGDAGRISPAVQIGNTGYNAANRILQVPFLGTDTGARSVESVTLSGTTGTAGNFGVTLYRPLSVICEESTHGVANVGFVTGAMFGGIPQLVSGACLQAITLTAGAAGAGVGSLLVAET